MVTTDTDSDGDTLSYASSDAAVQRESGQLSLSPAAMPRVMRLRLREMLMTLMVRKWRWYRRYGSG